MARIQFPDLAPDDPAWDMTAALWLRDGRIAIAEGMTLRELVGNDVLNVAEEDGMLIGGEIDPREVVAIGPDPDEDKRGR